MPCINFAVQKNALPKFLRRKFCSASFCAMHHFVQCGTGRDRTQDGRFCAVRQMVRCRNLCGASFWCGASFCAVHKAKKTGNIVSRNRNIVSRNQTRTFCRSKANCALQNAKIRGNIVSRNRNIVSRKMNIVSRKYDCSTA